MINKAAVRFRRAGRVQYFDAGDLKLFRGTHVIVETDRGMEYAEVALAPGDIPEEKEKTEAAPEQGEVAEEIPAEEKLRSIIRIATKEDDETYRENLLKEEEAFRICEKKIAEHELNMRLAGTDINFDGSKMIFYFTAESRVDFRELVKDLASCFRTRIELRQIGVRDETKIIGGLGTCGRELCCAGHLTEFAPVTIKMAKDQGLSLNPAKISGACGRLMCCLRNEEDTYEYLNSTMPRLGDTIVTEDGYAGDVTGLNILKQQVKVIIEVNGEREERILKPDEVTVTGHKKFKKGKEPVASPKEAGSLAAAVAKVTKDREEADRQEAKEAEEKNREDLRNEEKKNDNRRDKKNYDKNKNRKNNNYGGYKDKKSGYKSKNKSNSKNNKNYKKQYKDRNRNRDNNRGGRLSSSDFSDDE